MDKRKKNGGARIGAGRKPFPDGRKIHLNIYVEKSVVEKHGGKKEAQKKCYEFLKA